MKTNAIILPEEVQEYGLQITNALKKLAGKLNIKNVKEKTKVRLNKRVYLHPDFKQLWDRIKYKTTYRVDFDTEALIQACSQEIHKSLIIGSPKLITRKARLEVDRGGVQAETVKESTSLLRMSQFALPDILSYLQNQTNLTRRTLVDILIRSNRLEDFKKNPQKYIEQVAEIIKRKMRHFIVDGIKYQKIGNDSYYAQELFEDNELFGYLTENMLKSGKSVYDHVVYDSDIEKDFAQSFEKSDDVSVYAKLPGWFVIDTPP